MAIRGWPGPVSVATGILTLAEYAALDPIKAVEVEELTLDSMQQPGHDAAWFAKNRDEIREQLGFWLGIRLTGTSYVD